MGSGKKISEDDLLNICWELKDQGAHNINFVSPTSYVEILIRIMEKLKKDEFNIPFVWNTGGYESLETVKKLAGLVDIYLPDFKYASDDLAIKYSKAPFYANNVLSLLQEMRRQVKDEFDKEGLMKSGLIIRHLVLPNQLSNSRRVLDLIKATIGSKVLISLMAQYFPTFKASSYPELNRGLSQDEYNEIYDYYISLGFEDGYCQDLDSASSSYVPEFK